MSETTEEISANPEVQRANQRPRPALHRVNSYMYLHNSISKRITFGDELANACNDRGDVCLVRHGCVWAENQSAIVCSKADGYAKADTGSLRGAAELR